jgi:hypothetical protein
MCCLLAVGALFGPRFLGFVWWLLDPVRWGTTFPTPLFGLIGWLVVPWTTIAYVFTFPNGVEGLDWGLIALALLVDLGTTGGGAWGRERRRWRRDW